jgi:hypothetical protein
MIPISAMSGQLFHLFSTSLFPYFMSTKWALCKYFFYRIQNGMFCPQDFHGKLLPILSFWNVYLKKYNLVSTPQYHLLLLLLLLLLFNSSTARLLFLILYTVGRTPWTGDQPVVMSLPTQTHKWDLRPQPPCLKAWRHFMPYTARPLWLAQN